jgi:ankyrin repeat protein
MAADQPTVDECVGNAHGNLQRVRELLDLHPELVDARASWDESPLQAAAQMGDRAMIDLLLERGATLDFLTACVLGRTDEVRARLAENPALATERGVHGLAPLYFAAIGGRRDVAELLLAAGAGVDERAEAAAPIHGAVMGRSRELVAWLLEHGADPSAPDFKGRGAKQLAIEMDQQELAELIG